MKWLIAPTKLMGIIVDKEVLAAFLKSKPNSEIRVETKSVPPPMPIPALKRATKKPRNTNFVLNFKLNNFDIVII
jgi:hypothetical protein